eukprot:scaffold201539_cov23-Prasinocladus_malaysianus.AAC.1
MPLAFIIITTGSSAARTNVFVISRCSCNAKVLLLSSLPVKQTVRRLLVPDFSFAKQSFESVHIAASAPFGGSQSVTLFTQSVYNFLAYFTEPNSARRIDKRNSLDHCPDPEHLLGITGNDLSL